MKARIKKVSTGTLGVDWRIEYRLEVKTFIFWKFLADYDSLNKAISSMRLILGNHFAEVHYVSKN